MNKFDSPIRWEDGDLVCSTRIAPKGKATFEALWWWQGVELKSHPVAPARKDG